jgi:hypothetical protein
MRLLLFTLFCLVTLLVIRFLQRSSAGRTRAREQAAREQRPAASEDEIVDVRFEECPPPERKGEEDS